jgi:hypothetical protein
MQKPELLIILGPSGDPFLKGCCSACENVTFTYAGNCGENRRLMQEAFDQHFNSVHLPVSSSES